MRRYELRARTKEDGGEGGSIFEFATSAAFPSLLATHNHHLSNPTLTSNKPLVGKEGLKMDNGSIHLLRPKRVQNN